MARAGGSIFGYCVGVLTTPERYQQICRKLLESLHITAEERRDLGGDRILFSTLVATTQVALDEVNFLPASLRPDHEFEGVVIEQREDRTYVVHECHEIGVRRYSPVKSRVAKDLSDALRAYVRANGGTAIDGVPINFAG